MKQISNNHYTISWQFHDLEAIDGWELPEDLTPRRTGGTLWLRPFSDPPAIIPSGLGLSEHFIGFAGLNIRAPRFSSPSGLGLDNTQASKLHMHIRNCSPETDCLVWITTTGTPEKLLGPVAMPMCPYDTGWQDIVGHLDELVWEDQLDRFWLQFPNGQAGDIFIARIALAPGEKRISAVKPDVLGDALPLLSVPGITQAQFADAYAVLDEAVIHDPLPINGFPVPFIAPGAKGVCYGRNWWVLDASLAMHALLWTAPGFCCTMMCGFIDLLDDNPDGCLQHEGKIVNRGLPCDLSVIPRVFEAWAAIARISDDDPLRRRIYRAMTRHLNWWWSPVKRDPEVGLVSGFFEESFTYHGKYGPGEMVPVDTNVAVAVGARLCADLADELGYADEAIAHRKRFDLLAAAINRWLWNEEHGCYFNWLLHERCHRIIFASHMFDTLRFGIAPPERRERLNQRLFDPTQFGWGELGLTTVARHDPKFAAATGPFDGTAWNGDIWTMRNHPVIQGLRECGEYERAAQLAWHTVNIFAGTWAEYLEPDGGTGHGVERYSWTAGQWLQIIIEECFGLRWHAVARTLSINPLVPASLIGKELALNGLRLPDAARTCIDITLRRHADDQIEVKLNTEAVPDNAYLNSYGNMWAWNVGVATWNASVES